MAWPCSTYGEKKDLNRVLVGKNLVRDNLENPGADGRIILKWIFRKWDVGARRGWSWLRIGTSGGHL
jgi:hypothetical protein